MKTTSYNFPENELMFRMAEVRLAYSSYILPSQHCTITDSKDSYEIFRKHWNPDELQHFESFKVLYLSRANKCLYLTTISQGGITGTVADPRIILQYALLTNSTGIIMAHNHPSGGLAPSQADRDMTAKIKEGARAFDIKLLDHLIIAVEGYFSFADTGEL